jgi:hypothetical protein
VYKQLILDLVSPLYIALPGSVQEGDPGYEFVLQLRLPRSTGPVLTPVLPGPFPREDESLDRA